MAAASSRMGCFVVIGRVYLHRRCFIAATAKVHSLTVVTRNVSSFAHFEVDLLNPFEPGAGSQRP
ncbi:hypothetical protein RM96_23010 [Cupriavidus sp. IDO]|nr:hypothetical protein RM96_23010 [Cupriavidus sp. IDO]